MSLILAMISQCLRNVLTMSSQCAHKKGVLIAFTMSSQCACNVLAMSSQQGHTHRIPNDLTMCSQCSHKFFMN